MEVIIKNSPYGMGKEEIMETLAKLEIPASNIRISLLREQTAAGGPKRGPYSSDTRQGK